MEILIINNGTKHLGKLKELISFNNITIINPSEIDFSGTKKFDLIILSGRKSNLKNQFKGQHLKEIELVRNTQKPILGICFGLKLIAYAFGGKSEKLPKKKIGIVKIKVIKKDKVFKNFSNFKAYESHFWALKKLPKDFIGLAKSESGFEIIKHKRKMIYAFQFHPEMFVKKNSGAEIFNNFLNLIKK